MRRLALLALLLAFAPSAVHAYGTSQCAGDRFGQSNGGQDLGCTANDVQLTNMQALNAPASCSGGGTMTLDLQLTVNFGSASRYDIGIFLANDGKDPQKTVANGGATSCSVAILPSSSPFLNLDSNGGTDLCGDGNSSINGGTGSGQLTMTGVTVACQALNTTGQLYVPFVVSWDQQASPSGFTCRTIADPVPGAKSKCNAPVIGLTPQVIVLPAITKTDGKTQITPGDTATYTIAINNNTGVTLSTANANAAVFKDPAVTNLAVSSVTCAVTTGTATCPAAGSVTVAAMQGAGITIPSMSNGSVVTFTVNAQLNNNPTGTLTNTATVTSNGQTASASDTDTIVYPSLVNAKSSTALSDPYNGATNPKRIPGGAVRYDVTVTNTGAGTVNANTFFIYDAIPANTALYVNDYGGAGSGPVSFSNGSLTSSLTYTFTSLASATDDVAFSNDGGATYDYTPVPNANGVDPNVTNLRVNPKGTFAGDPVAGAPSPSCTASFRVRIQ
jgi:uncharacterized repeat protein (TIGR01451 family)